MREKLEQRCKMEQRFKNEDLISAQHPWLPNVMDRQSSCRSFILALLVILLFSGHLMQPPRPRTLLSYDTRTPIALIIELKEPSRFQWGPKFICHGKREDTITGVVLLNGQLLVAAHRESALLYSIQFDLYPRSGKGPTYQVLDVLSIYDQTSGAYRHPDLLKGDRFGRMYSTFFSNTIGVFEVNQASKRIETLDYLTIGNETSSSNAAPLRLLHRCKRADAWALHGRHGCRGPNSHFSGGGHV